MTRLASDSSEMDRNGTFLRNMAADPDLASLDDEILEEMHHGFATVYQVVDVIAQAMIAGQIGA